MTNVKTPFCFETQGPCGSVRKGGADTLTADSSAQVKDVTPTVARISVPCHFVHFVSLIIDLHLGHRQTT